MKVLLDMVISPNGMIARENGDEDWLPHIGWVEFLAEAKKHNNIVMGRETYQLVTELYDEEDFDAVEADLKVIVSTNKNLQVPPAYTVVSSPEDAVMMVKKKGLKTFYLIGGGKLNNSFIRKGLVDEIHLTICPYIVGRGRSFVGEEDFDLPLELVKAQSISEGRVSLDYKILKDKVIK